MCQGMGPSLGQGRNVTGTLDRNNTPPFPSPDRPGSTSFPLTSCRATALSCYNLPYGRCCSGGFTPFCPLSGPLPQSDSCLLIPKASSPICLVASLFYFTPFTGLGLVLWSSNSVRACPQSCPTLLSPSPPAFNLSQNQGLFQ